VRERIDAARLGAHPLPHSVGERCRAQRGGEGEIAPYAIALPSRGR
jgi:hypothetical protein